MLGLMIFVPVIYIAIAWAIIKRLPSKKAKWIATAIIILIPTWDEIAGRIYLKYLCETESGVRVYKTVELPAEYWDANEKPKFITADGRADPTVLEDRYTFDWNVQEHFSDAFHIKKSVRNVSDARSKEILGEYIRFVYFGGWVVNHSGAHVTETGCPAIEEYDYRGFLGQIFKPQRSMK